MKVTFASKPSTPIEVMNSPPKHLKIFKMNITRMIFNIVKNMIKTKKYAKEF